MARRLSIIIPVLNEASVLEQTLRGLQPLRHEVIVVDGGSRDASVSIGMIGATHVLVSPPGRGIQQQRGSLVAGGDVFLFLHADTLPPTGFTDMIDAALLDPRVTLGAFHLGIYPSSPWLRLVAHMANLRSLILKMPYGDQGLFMRRSDYFRVGGFRDWPLMEDVDLVRRLTRIGRFRLVEGAVRTSARRWQREGPCYVTLRNWSLAVRYRMGASPEKLARFYREVR